MSGPGGESSRGPVKPPPSQSQPLPPVGDPPLGGPITGSPLPGQTLDAKLLILSADGKETDLPAIKQALDFLGTPYTVWVAAKNPGGLRASALAKEQHGFYQGVILATAALVAQRDGGTKSALSAAEWTALYSYEASFGVRQVNWYSYPTPKLGFGSTPTLVDTTAKPLSVTVTSAGAAIFSYLNSANRLRIKNVFAYLARPTADEKVIPLLSDASGNAIAVEQKYPDGRDFLTVTVDSDPFQVHTLALQYGLINWVTKGVFIGERHAYMGIQVDDLLIETDRWNKQPSYRMTAADLDAALAWQTARRKDAITRELTLNFAFNGGGAYADGPDDPLADEVKRLRDSFYFISHSFSHPESLSTMSYAAVKKELTQNLAFADKFRFSQFTPTSLVTPALTGLDSADSMRAIYDSGVRYVVSAAWIPGQDNPSPNAGNYNAFQPGVLEIPRWPSSLDYDLLTPSDWVSQYNARYHDDWGRDLTYPEILDAESDVFLLYILRWDLDPWMFHQGNLGLHDRTHSLLSDLMDAVLKKYAAIATMPLLSLPQDQLGQRMAQRMQFDKSSVSGVITPDVSIKITVKRAATVPVTGARMAGAETYAGQSISYATLKDDQSITLPLK